MFRAFVLSVVLILAVGPETALLCRAWCHPPAVATAACHDEKPSTNDTAMSRDGTCHDCAQAGVGAVQFVREDVRFGLAARTATDAIITLRYQLVAPVYQRVRDEDPRRGLSGQQRPLSTPLRI